MKHRNWSVGNEVSIHGLEWPSNGPLAILLHANGLCAESWIVVAEKLTERYRVFALDARGHGGSSSPTPPHAYDWQHFVSDTISVCNQILTETGYSDFALVAGSSLGVSSVQPWLRTNVNCFVASSCLTHLHSRSNELPRTLNRKRAASAETR